MVLLQCAEYDDGHSVRVPLSDFYEYMTHQQDDSPLYIFDSTFGYYDKVSNNASHLDNVEPSMP